MGASAREGRVVLLMKEIEGRGTTSCANTDPSSAQLTCGVCFTLRIRGVWDFFPKKKTKIRSPKCKCIHVTYLPVFSSTSNGMAFYISYVKNSVRNTSQSYNGYFHLSKANSLKEKCFDHGKNPHVLFNFYAIKVLHSRKG